MKKIYLGPDPDREGEAIAWHIAEEIGDGNKDIYRVLFNEITQKGVLEALKHPGSLQPSKYEAQQARRILDRLVGYQISPLLWDKVRRGLSAGRVQSVRFASFCEREKRDSELRSKRVLVYYCDIERQNFPPLHSRPKWLNGEGERST